MPILQIRKLEPESKLLKASGHPWLFFFFPTLCIQTVKNIMLSAFKIYLEYNHHQNLASSLCFYFCPPLTLHCSQRDPFKMCQTIARLCLTLTGILHFIQSKSQSPCSGMQNPRVVLWMLSTILLSHSSPLTLASLLF